MIANIHGAIIGAVSAIITIIDNKSVVIAGPVILTNGKTFFEEFGGEWVF